MNNLSILHMVLIYLGGFVFTVLLLKVTNGKDEIISDNLMVVLGFLCIFWPITLPFIAGFSLIWYSGMLVKYLIQKY